MNNHASGKLPALTITPGAIEILKWFGIICMTADHINKYLLHEKYGWMFALGRLTVPIFCFVLGYNLATYAKPGNQVFERVLQRLSLFGAISSVPYIALGNLTPGAILWNWWPLNILVMLLVSTACIYFLAGPRSTKRNLAFVLCFIFGGAIVEFWWPAILICIFAWRLTLRTNWTDLVLLFLAVASLSFINGNSWALAALPVIYGAKWLRPVLFRSKWFFYSYYPMHLLLILTVLIFRP